MSTKKALLYVPEDDTYVFECPHCNIMIQVVKKEVNCKIFRHGVLRSTNKQINPHTPKNECDRLFNEELIYGCGKPFKLIPVEGFAYQCDYI